MSTIGMGRLRFELRTSRLKAGCSTAELATRPLGHAISGTNGHYHSVRLRISGRCEPVMAPLTSASAPWPAAQIHPGAWVSTSAVVIGEVTMEEGSSLWPTAVARGDCAEIRIGARSNVQDGAVLHGDPGQPVLIGVDVTVGHRAVIHGATLSDGCLVGIGAIVLNGVTVGEGALVAAGAVVTKDVPARSLVMGAPAQLKRELSAEAVEDQRNHAHSYAELARQHAQAGG